MPFTELDVIDELVGLGLERREARWIIEEFGVGGESGDAVRAAAQRRLNGEPLQYVLGHWPFRTLDLEVDARVLIPRPETEGLVEVALSELAVLDHASPMVLDLGCGSGAIGLAILSELAARGVASSLVAIDESEGALEVARANARKHRLTAATFLRSHWFDALDVSLRHQFALVASNPPYVGMNELDGLDPVLRHEPIGALVADDIGERVGFADVDAVIRGSVQWLRPGGILVVEHASTHGSWSREIAREIGFASAQTVSDLAGLDRLLVARMPA